MLVHSTPGFEFTIPLPVAAVAENPPMATTTSMIATDPHSETWPQWVSLVEHYRRAWLNAHKWEWKDGDWLPHYQYQAVGAITELWMEYTEGLGGHLSTHKLKEHWGAKWQRNKGSLKTEGGRHAKVTTLVEELATKWNWSVSLALRFIKEKHESDPAYLGKMHAFCDYLQKDCDWGYKAVLEAAAHYP